MMSDDDGEGREFVFYMGCLALIGMIMIGIGQTLVWYFWGS